MYRRIIWMVVGFGAAVLSAILFTRPELCYACAQAVPPPDCSVNMSAMTVRKADDRRNVVADLRPQGSAHTAGLPGHEYEQRRRPAALHL